MQEKQSRNDSRKRQRRRERGQAMLEFALTAPILVLLVLGIAEIGHGLNSYLTIVAAARDGARLGAEGEASEASIKALVQKETERLSPTIPAACAGNAPGICVTNTTVSSTPAVKVRVCHNHSLLVGIPGVLSGPMLMCSQTAMRVAS